MAINFQGTSEFRIFIKSTNGDTYGGCAADVNGQWQANAEVRVDPKTCSSSVNGDLNEDYKVFFGDTEGQIRISELILDQINTTSVETSDFSVDLTDVQSITIQQTAGNYEYQVQFTKCIYPIGEGISTQQIADNVYYVREYNFQIIRDNGTSGTDSYAVTIPDEYDNA
jgi:hypothetical protein